MPASVRSEVGIFWPSCALVSPSVLSRIVSRWKSRYSSSESRSLTVVGSGSCRTGVPSLHDWGIIKASALPTLVRGADNLGLQQRRLTSVADEEAIVA